VIARLCASVIGALPSTVDDAQLRRRDQLVAAWGDPAIVLRCGVPRPAALLPTSRCDGVNGVGWFTETLGDGYRFTTIGRAAYVEVTVPAHYSPAANALVDLAPAVGRLADVTPCQ